ncbi:MAG: hypothetical protein WC272_02275 [Sulfurimonas sp.]|jgi:hypothetical protein
MKILEKSLLQKRYSIREYIEYVNEIKSQLHTLNDAMEIDKFNLREGIYKKLIEEAYPLAYFLKYHFGLVDDKFVMHCVDRKIRTENTESYDAEITDYNEKNIGYLEVVYPTDGKASKIATQQMIYARKNNIVSEIGVSYNGKVETDISRPKGQQKYISDNEVRWSDNYYIIEKILKKNGNKNYLPNTVLIVSFDDALFHVHQDSYENFKNYMCDKLSGKIDNFLFLAFIARSGEYYFTLQSNLRKLEEKNR